ncbi:MAG: hypothetical protein COS30_02275 [Candidatus Portnoybacteria bacterium CG02_land_8_20_14_3_00_45_8]|uniref:Thioredoxin domain-containing protein n=1 Tax=Candidatus Portnoybacteria bacterium CG02_land_8_20_14_3_00_45_8 TaxID=1974807 RepID=A0A2M7D5X1_9BACT|nr:MAG: hypothetical protein COS30_02275 [Candidatus Portnoybacteria bacterium CG02_land_8_20_14_3_00_45_8]
MSDKKIIIAAVILSLILAGGGWYYSKHRPPSAAIVNQADNTKNSAVSQPGISLGNPAAPVVIEEYTNFLCPACASFAMVTFDQINDNYVKSGKVKFVFYIFPPLELGRAAICAQEQNKFIEYHTYLFEHQGQITEEKNLRDFAINIGIDGTKFDSCYAAQATIDKSTAWTNEGSSRGVDSTPTFFINGQKLIGAQPYEDFKKVIDEKLNQL